MTTLRAAVATLLLAAPAGFAYDPTSDYEVRTMQGWTLRVHKTLLEKKPDLAKQSLAVMDRQLKQMVEVLPKKALAELRKSEIWMEHFHPGHPCACYHPDRNWLIANGFNPDKAGAVEIANPGNFVDWVKTQPWMLLHELAHAYHHEYLGYDHPELNRAFANAERGGRYESVLHYTGGKIRHYAMSNPQEYFAEATEAYFGKNDYYPFVRAELKTHDPDMYALIRKLWGVNQAMRGRK